MCEAGKILKGNQKQKQYRVVKYIGQGGNGTVFLAEEIDEAGMVLKLPEDRENPRQVAIKFMKCRVTVEERESFRLEVKTLLQLHADYRKANGKKPGASGHPNLIEVEDAEILDEAEITKREALNPEMPMITNPEMPMAANPEMPMAANPGMPMTANPEMPMITNPGMPMAANPEMPMTTNSEMAMAANPGMPMWYAMEYLEGPGFGEWLHEEPRKQEIVEHFVQITDAIWLLHKKNCVHRDIKPQNIKMRLKRRKGEAKGKEEAGMQADVKVREEMCPVILDLGLVYNPSLLARTSCSLKGIVLYMSPEQIQGKAHGKPVDVWALGVMLYEALTKGKHPYITGICPSTPISVMNIILHEPYQNPKGYEETLDDVLSNICAKALEKEAGKRYEDALEMQGALRSWRNENARLWQAKAQEAQKQAQDWTRQAKALQAKASSTKNPEELQKLKQDIEKAEDQAMKSCREEIEYLEKCYIWAIDVAIKTSALEMLKECWRSAYPLHEVHTRLESEPPEESWKMLEAREMKAPEATDQVERYVVFGVLKIVPVVQAIITRKAIFTFGLPEDLWAECSYDHEGTRILDMSTSTWQKLSVEYQGKYARQYQIGYVEASQQGLIQFKGLELEIVIDKGRANIPLILIPPGRFLMGSPEDEAGRYGDENQHLVVITKPYYMGKTSVTQEQWEAVVSAVSDKEWKKIFWQNGWPHDTMPSQPSRFKESGPSAPVESVDWYECVAFCEKLGCALPTEAEWEFSCRGGSTKKWCFGDDEARLSEYAWYRENSENHTHPVAAKGKKSGELGLYDMHGNIWEWISDWYGDYPGGSVTDPVGPKDGSSRVNRGGGWYNAASRCRSALRFFTDPGAQSASLGFRVCVFGLNSIGINLRK